MKLSSFRPIKYTLRGRIALAHTFKWIPVCLCLLHLYVLLHGVLLQLVVLIQHIRESRSTTILWDRESGGEDAEEEEGDGEEG